MTNLVKRTLLNEAYRLARLCEDKLDDYDDDINLKAEESGYKMKIRLEKTVWSDGFVKRHELIDRKQPWYWFDNFNVNKKITDETLAEKVMTKLVLEVNKMADQKKINIIFEALSDYKFGLETDELVKIFEKCGYKDLGKGTKAFTNEYPEGENLLIRIVK